MAEQPSLFNPTGPAPTPPPTRRKSSGAGTPPKPPPPPVAAAPGSPNDPPPRRRAIGPRARRTDPTTAHEAARALEPGYLSGLKGKIVEALRSAGPAGLIGYEIAHAIPGYNEKRDTLSPRMTEMEAAWLIVRTGTTRVAPSGNAQEVWRLRLPDDPPPPERARRVAKCPYCSHCNGEIEL